jgi:hypothetical protein
LDSLDVVDNHAFGPMNHFLWMGDEAEESRIFGNYARTVKSAGYGISIENRSYKGNNTMRGFAA